VSGLCGAIALQRASGRDVEASIAVIEGKPHLQGLDQSWNSGRRHIAQQTTQGGLVAAPTGLLRAQFVFLGPAGCGLRAAVAYSQRR
jgi:hypothetical protein